MEKVGEEEEKTIEEASNSIEERESDKEDERIRGKIAVQVDPVDSTGGSMDPSNSHTVAFKDPDFNESDMEDEEEVLEFFRRNSGLTPDQVPARNNFSYLNNSEGMVLQFQEDSPAETEQTNVMFNRWNDNNEITDLHAVNFNSLEILEGIKSSSASTDDTEDSSSNTDLDSSLSRYYFDGSLPVSSHVEESETHQDESPLPRFAIKIDASTVPQATCTTTNFMEKLLRAFSAPPGCC